MSLGKCFSAVRNRVKPGVNCGGGMSFSRADAGFKIGIAFINLFLR